MGRFLTALRALLYMSAFLSVWGWVALALRRYDPALGGPLPSWTPPIGVILMVSGAALALACVGLFVLRGRGTPAPFDAPREFVAVGPYGWVRNPMYVGGLVFLFGLALLTRSPTMLLFVVPMALLAHAFVRLYEEPVLRQRFGDSYAQYLGDVSRWIPRPPAKVVRHRDRGSTRRSG